MKKYSYFEIIVGTFVLLSAILFFYNSFSKANVSSKKGYEIIAKFDNIDGIAIGSDVKISGLKIGSVTSQSIDKSDFRAILHLNISNDIKLPYDSSLKVSSEGLLGAKYLALSPGAAEEFLENGEEIEYTQSSVNLEELLGKFIFNSKSENE